MKIHYLLAVLFLLTLSTPAFSQQNFVLQDDRNAPCGLFKMRVLLLVQQRRDLEVGGPFQDVDNKMVWNPCPRTNLNKSAKAVEPAAQNRSNYFLVQFDKVPRRFDFLRPKSAAPVFGVKPKPQPWPSNE